MTWAPLALLLAAAADAGAKGPSPAIPSASACGRLALPSSGDAIPPGEVLEFDLDALGARAGRMTLSTRQGGPGTLIVGLTAQTNTFFSKVRRVVATATSTLASTTLQPSHYLEDAREDGFHRIADVRFDTQSGQVRLKSSLNEATVERQFHAANGALDVTGAIYLLRRLPLRAGLPVCFDAYALRALWRVWGQVVGREEVTTPMGVFPVWHIQGQGARLEPPEFRREIHVWITDDARRIPIAALGAIDLGAVRATLVGLKRPGERPRKADAPHKLKW